MKTKYFNKQSMIYNTYKYTIKPILQAILAIIVLYMLALLYTV